MIGEVQYDTGIPKYFYNVTPVHYSHPEQPAPVGLGGDLFSRQVSSVSTGSNGLNITTGASSFQQITGAVGTAGNIAATIIDSFNRKSVDKRRIKMEERIATLQIQMQGMTEQQRIDANIEIARIESEMEYLVQQESSRFGIGMTQILAVAGVASIGLIGMFAVLSQDK